MDQTLSQTLSPQAHDDPYTDWKKKIEEHFSFISSTCPLHHKTLLTHLYIFFFLKCDETLNVLD